MRKNTENMMKGAAMGLLAGGVMGAAGACAANQKPKEMKKLMKKAATGAEHAMEVIEHALNQR